MIFFRIFWHLCSCSHAAGVAALMIEAQKFKNPDPALIKKILASNVIDMDNPETDGFDEGFDFATGAGFIKADAAVATARYYNEYFEATKKFLALVNRS